VGGKAAGGEHVAGTEASRQVCSGTLGCVESCAMRPWPSLYDIRCRNRLAQLTGVGCSPEQAPSQLHSQVALHRHWMQKAALLLRKHLYNLVELVSRQGLARKAGLAIWAPNSIHGGTARD